jgi:anti-sigma factor RsiW
MNHIADNQDALLDYLYEEGDPAQRLAIAQHLQECAPCSVAVLELQSVRGMLKDWTPPASQLGFRVVQDATHQENWGPATTKETWRGWRPALQAAAALLLFVSGMAVSQLDVDYRDGTLTVRRASAAAPGIRNASIVLPAERVNTAGASTAAAPVDIAEIERDLRARLESQNASSIDTERLLQRVRAMIDQSEQRQQRELALRLSQVAREVDTQHQADLLRIQQDFGQQQEATMDYLVRTSGGAK